MKYIRTLVYGAVVVAMAVVLSAWTHGASVTGWILATGVWNDAGAWQDSATWID